LKQAFSFFQTSRQLVWRKYFPALFFLAGFVWDALTIGRQVQQTDLIILSSYLVAAAAILWWLAHQTTQASLDTPEDSAKTIVRILPQAWREPAPYFLLQFLYGSLLSALFILYFKSAGHVFAWIWALLLAAILIGNEFLERHYQQNTVAWTMFGFCAILLFNFVLPCLFGSIHWAWFVLSTIAGAGLTHVFYYKSKEHVTHPLTHIAPNKNYFIIAINPSKEILNAKIKKRLDERFDQGMIKEVENLHDQGVSFERLEAFGLEYRWIALFLQGKLDETTMREKLYFDIIHYAKRQRTWLRRWEKQGADIHWIQAASEINVSL